jgi:transcriptional regulator with XRE-family HTH domain
MFMVDKKDSIFAKKLRFFMAITDLSDTDLGKLCDMEPSIISKHRRAETSPSLKSIEAYAAAFNVKAEVFLNDYSLDFVLMLISEIEKVKQSLNLSDRAAEAERIKADPSLSNYTKNYILNNILKVEEQKDN